ncbi:MAG: hypothetical protein Aureis2KO_10380 [Aureisphaera sp.]
MKKLLLVGAILFITMQSQAQDQRLFDDLWYLTQISVDGQVIAAPNNAEVNNIHLDLENLSPPNQDFQTQVCGFLAGNASYSTTLPEFSISGLIQSVVMCDDPDNNIFQQQYYDIYLDNNSDPYVYSIQDNGNGDLELTITAVNGDQAFYSNQTLSVSDISALRLEITPNPVSERLLIAVPNTRIEKFSVFDLNGKMVMQQANNDDTLFVGGLPSGVYFLEASTETQSVIQKFVKK